MPRRLPVTARHQPPVVTPERQPPALPLQVLHDCRPAAQALFDFPGRSINLQGVIDTQVRCEGQQCMARRMAQRSGVCW